MHLTFVVGKCSLCHIQTVYRQISLRIRKLYEGRVTRVCRLSRVSGGAGDTANEAVTILVCFLFFFSSTVAPTNSRTYGDFQISLMEKDHHQTGHHPIITARLYGQFQHNLTCKLPHKQIRFNLTGLRARGDEQPSGFQISDRCLTVTVFNELETVQKCMNYHVVSRTC